MADDEGKQTQDPTHQEVEQQTFDQILAADDGHEEQLDLEARERFEEYKADQSKQAETDTVTPAGDQQADQQSDERGAREQQQDEDLPLFMDKAYRDRHPKDPDNWRALRTQRDDFRSKAREAEGRIDTLERELAQLRGQQQPQRAAPTLPDPDDNPEGYRQGLTEQIRSEVRAELEADRAQRENQRFNRSEADAIAKHGQQVVDVAFERFSALAQNNPGLADRLSQAHDPYEYIIQEVERQTLLEEIQDPRTYKQRIREELEAEIAAKAGNGEQDRVNRLVAEKIRERMPTSMAGVPGAGQNASEEAYTGPPTMDQILDR